MWEKVKPMHCKDALVNLVLYLIYVAVQSHRGACGLFVCKKITLNLFEISTMPFGQLHREWNSDKRLPP